MATVRTLYSGSSGNCTLIKDKTAILLIDMGKSCRETVNALNAAGTLPEEISAVLVTHEHSDHISGLGVFLKKYNIPVFGSAATLEYLYNNELVPECDLIDVEPNQEILMGGVSFAGFRTSHDSADCYGYRFTFENNKTAAIATDLGYISDSVMENLMSRDFIGLESNYDKQMLRFGDYPAYLKKRIASRFGHLSNDDCALTLASLAAKGTQKFMLMHLSLENNTPDIALTTSLCMLENQKADACSVWVAPRYKPGEEIEV